MNPWIAVYAPANTPRALIDRLNAEINTALKLPGVMQSLTNQVLDPWPGTPDEFAWVAWLIRAGRMAPWVIYRPNSILQARLRRIEGWQPGIAPPWPWLR